MWEAAFNSLHSLPTFITTASISTSLGVLFLSVLRATSRYVPCLPSACAEVLSAVMCSWPHVRPGLICACTLLLCARPNIVISGPTAYAEDEWAGLHISAVLAPAGTTEAGAMAAGTAAAAAAGSGRASSAGDATTAAQPTVVLASVGACPRCDMVCADPSTGRWVCG